MYELKWDSGNRPAAVDLDGKYDIASNGIGKVTVTEAPVTVTADAKTKIYDNGANPDPELTYTTDASKLVTEAGTIDYASDFVLSGELTRSSGESVGTYPILQGTLTAGSNYAVNYNGADFTIEKETITVSLNPYYSTTYLW